MYLAIKYILFAILATLSNILSQDLAGRLYWGVCELYFSMFWGTLVGLVIKYVLDKRYIFSYQTRNIMEDSQKFVLYSIMGIITTCIFWGVELGFDFVFGTKSMRYTGAVIGLAIGYLIKYRLDKRFVFTKLGG
jgi:putative flippase GtrA